MKLPKLKMGLPLTLATGIYLTFSLLGCLFYLTLPPVLCSIGARFHTYLLVTEAMKDQHTVAMILLVVLSQLSVLLLAVLGIRTIVKGPGKLYLALIALDICLTLPFLFPQSSSQFNDTQGLVLNIAYFIWLMRTFLTKKAAAAPAAKAPAKKKKGK